MLAQGAMVPRYLRRMRTFLRAPIDAAAARRAVVERLECREQAFVELLARGVYAVPGSPYRQLLRWAGVELGDVCSLAADSGVEGALESLYDAGVTITLEEMKGRRPIVRPGFELGVRASDFDNPLATAHWHTSTGGSTGAAMPLVAGFDGLEVDSCYYRLCLEAFGADERRPAAMWLMAPPGAASMQQLFRTLKVRGELARWWTPTHLRWHGSTLPHSAFVALTLAGARGAGHRVPFPRYLAPDRALVAAQWLEQTARNRQPAVFSSTVSAAARICKAADEAGADISQTLFILGGEPYTEAAADAVGAAGATAAASYYVTEIGQIGIACADAVAVDDVHLTTDVLGVICRPRAVPGAEGVQALFHTTLSPSAPKLMLNVESGDHGVVQTRACSCPAAKVGLTTHLHHIRSYEKLTLEGMQIFGGELAKLIEEILPRRFGGLPQQYQFLERRAGTRVTLVIRASPHLGPLDEDALIQAVLRHLRSHSAGHQAMAETLAGASALQVSREEPHVTSAGKTPVLCNTRAAESPVAPVF